MTEDRHKNRKAALAWLQEHGQISAGKFYGDCEKGYADINGRRYPLVVAPDKTISKFQVAEYGNAIFAQAAPAGAQVDYSEQRAALELRKLKLDVDKAELANRREDANWLDKETAWAQMAAIIGTLRDSLRHQFHLGAAALVHAAGGDHSRVPEVYEAAEELLARAFNEVVSSGRIEGVFEAGEQDH